ncbi:spermatogenesis-associated protein 7-like isoform X2 [Centruroides vittatus]
MQSRNTSAKSLTIIDPPTSSFGNNGSAKCENLSEEYSNVNNLFPSYLCLKSSVLSPSSTRLTSQYLALEQLCAHYQMISNAKAQVDNSAPKSMQSSLSHLGQKKKEYWQKSAYSRSVSPLIKLNASLPREECNSTSDIPMRRYSSSDLTPDDKVSWYLNSVKKNRGKRMFAAPIQGEMDISTPEKPKNNSQNVKNTVSVADKLSWYLDAVQQGAFQEYASNYPGFGSFSTDSDDEQSQNNIQTRIGSTKKQNASTSKDSRHRKNSTDAKSRISKTKSKLLEMKCYHPPVQQKKANMKYHPKLHSEDSSEDTDRSHNLDCDRTSWRHYRRNSRKELSHNPKTFHFKLRQYHHQDSFDFPIQRYRGSLEFVNRNEEMYLNFLSTVTEDILKRGIYTDGAIKKAFKFHMKQQKELNVDIMQQLMDQFLDDLSIPKEELNEQQNSVRRTSPPEREKAIQDHLDENSNEGNGVPLQKILEQQANSSVEEADSSSNSINPIKETSLE